MRRLPTGNGEADQPIQSQGKDCDNVSTTACDGAPHRSGSSEPAINDRSLWSRAAICLAAIVICGIVIFEIYRIRKHDLLSAQATNVGETFIHSSPLVEKDLGAVKAVKETSEEHHISPVPGWYVNFDVSGKRRSGIVEMRLRKTNGEWNVPSANLKMGPTATVNLR